MTQYKKNVWDQIKNITCDDIIRALLKDGFILDETKNNTSAYYHPESKRRITIHYHPGKTYGPNLLKKMFDDIEWGEKDFKRLKLIK
jgi:predicted RNA binding protein YcfA (HicA-like mRNA interferase family)